MVRAPLLVFVWLPGQRLQLEKAEPFLLLLPPEFAETVAEFGKHQRIHVSEKKFYLFF
jgi:hypothetical protein